MRAVRSVLLCLLAWVTIGTPVRAQEEHPLKGTWLGNWEAKQTERTPVTIVFDWDGKNITGVINPGPHAVPIQKATLAPKGW